MTGPTASRQEILARRGSRDFVLVDVLPAESYHAGHLPGAISLPLADIDGRASNVLPDRSADIVVYCGGFT